ncbi:transposase [Duganella sp. Root198D2]|uniref:transposase n=1 Tax=Duganella sp. Root198D2 TaxID=1736489 RepID=UPI0009E74ECD
MRHRESNDNCEPGATGWRHFRTYIGVTPRQRQSGTSVHGRTMMSRMGEQIPARSFILASLVVKRHSPTLKQFGQRLEANGRSKNGHGWSNHV